MPITRDLMLKIGDDVKSAMVRTLTLTDKPLPVALAGGAAAVGIIAAILESQGETYAKANKPDNECVMLAALLIARTGTEHPDAVAQAYIDLRRLNDASH